MTLDFIPHAYLLARHFNGPRQILSTLGSASQWPLTILRFLINCLMIAVIVYCVMNGEIKSKPAMWIWVVILMTGTLLLGVTQIWCHFVYQDLVTKDQKAKAEIKSLLSRNESSTSIADDVTVENLQDLESVKVPKEADSRSVRRRKAVQRARTRYFLIGIQLAGIIAAILGVALHRGHRVCDSHFDDGLRTPQTESDTWMREMSLNMRRNGFVHVNPSDSLALPPSLGGALGSTYDRIYNLLGKPPGSSPTILTDDSYFARSKVTFSPDYLTLVPSLSLLPINNITDSNVTQTLSILIQQRRLFSVDHSGFMSEFIQFLRPGVYGSTPKALFYVDDKEDLMPFGIQLFENGTMYTPSDGWEWVLAKMAFRAAETTRIGFVDHYVETHLSLIPFSTSLNRMLSPTHPAYVILDGILQKNIGVVASGPSFGLSTGFDILLGPCMTKTPTTSLTPRGLDAIPNNPHLKHITTLHKASQTLFANLLSIYYPTDESVAADTELQNFAWDVTTNGRVQGFPSTFKTRAEISRALGHLHYTTTPRHALLTSFGYTASLPSAPLGFFKELPRGRAGVVNEGNIVEWLPGLDLALAQAGMMRGYSRPLEEYEILINMFLGFEINSPKTRCVLQNYRDSLRRISRDVQRDARDDSVVVGWDVLDPYCMSNYATL
ncbi:Mitogen-activated protein kinase 4a [Chytridiales sp. JEL 0842]|nr:Mitogen-activated protein kinase 4a [Chytridiales sp. JEL 0842]